MSTTGKKERIRHTWAEGDLTESEYQAWQNSRDPFAQALFPCTGNIIENVLTSAWNISVVVGGIILWNRFNALK